MVLLYLLWLLLLFFVITSVIVIASLFLNKMVAYSSATRGLMFWIWWPFIFTFLSVFIHPSPGMCGTPEQTLTSRWASSSMLKRLNPRCSPRPPSCWDWERLTNKYSALWPVCALARKHIHHISQTFSVCSTPWTCCCETFCRAARGGSGLSHAGSVHAAHQAPPKGENVKRHCGWNRMHVRKTNAFSKTCFGFRWRSTSLQRSLPTGRRWGMTWVSFTLPAGHWCDPPTKQVSKHTLSCTVWMYRSGGEPTLFYWLSGLFHCTLEFTVWDWRILLQIKLDCWKMSLLLNI